MEIEVTAIWQQDETGWKLLAPTGFPTEAELHDLVESAPNVLPLAGEPFLTILGREVLLGSNYADLIGIEPSGRLAIIEIKLAKNAEARRAVVAQILTYAAFLRGLTPSVFENDIIAHHVRGRGYLSVRNAVSANDLGRMYDDEIFDAEFAKGLTEGWFRLVLVLDDAPEELVRLVGYLQAVTHELVIDLITVASFRIGESQVVVPRRVEPETIRTVPGREPAHGQTHSKANIQRGAVEFDRSIDAAQLEQQPLLRRLSDWAKTLESEGLADLYTTIGVSNRWALIPRVKGHDAGMIGIWNEKGASLSFARSALERFAPNSLSRIEEFALPAKVGANTTTRNISDELIAALTDAYREASRTRLEVGSGL